MVLYLRSSTFTVKNPYKTGQSRVVPLVVVRHGVGAEMHYASLFSPSSVFPIRTMQLPVVGSDREKAVSKAVWNQQSAAKACKIPTD